MTVEEKIRILRKSAKITQDAFAKVINREVRTIIRAENELESRCYSQEEIDAIREFLCLGNAPLTVQELATYKEQLYVWRERIKEELLDEARRLHAKLADITKLPFETELNALYKMIEVRLLLKLGDLDAASDILSEIAPSVEQYTKEIQYHYYYAKGSLGIYQRNFEDALESYLTARNLEVNEFEVEKEAALHFNIALCYSSYGMYFQAIASFERISNLFSYDRTSATGVIFENCLALDYIKIGHSNKGKEILYRVLARAKALENKIGIGHALHNLGFAYSSPKEKEYEKALPYFKQAMSYYQEGDNFYLENLYYQIRCMIALKSHEYNTALLNAKSKAETNEYYSMHFEFLHRLATTKEKEASMIYIEETAIPFLLDRYEYFKALDYCEELEMYYSKNEIKLSEIKKIITDIQKRMSREKINSWE